MTKPEASSEMVERVAKAMRSHEEAAVCSAGGGGDVRPTKLTQIIWGEPVSGETPVKRKERKRLSVAFYRERIRKAWETRRRLKASRAAGEAKRSAA